MTRVEICLDDLAGAVLAETCGADRIELCAALGVGGTTPSIGTVEAVLGSVRSLGVQVLVRQREGDFVYSRAEIAAMCADIVTVRELHPPAGVTVGFVIGALTPYNTIDVRVMHELLDACGGAPVTFHKAFDQTQDLFASLETLMTLGVQRVLTAGGTSAAVDGQAALADLVRRAGEELVVMAGGGVRASNVVELVGRTGIKEVHLRASGWTPSASAHRNAEFGYDLGRRLVTSAEVIAELKAALRRGKAEA
ncbi:MAG: copper homeostasis protein CutC [Microbacteriaceae bacterium]|nr:MAG: copper homeostasis protein CutC [Microbacteriaceae bacterium]